MTQSDLPIIPRVTLGRTNIETTRLGLGSTGWPLERSYEQVIEVLRTAFEAGIRYIDLAPLYGECLKSCSSSRG